MLIKVLINIFFFSDNLQECSLRPYAECSVCFNLIESMLDGKQKKIKTLTPAYCRCIVCKQPPKILAHRRHPKFGEIDEEALKLGISLLHSHQRFFCWTLKGCKHRDFRNYSCTKPFKKDYKKRKLQMQRQFKKYMGLFVDFPKHGTGNSTTGMTAKIAFKRPKLLAKIVHVPYFLIKGWKDMMDALNSGYKVCPEKFDVKANEWLDFFHSDESIQWNILNSATHCLLHHGKLILSSTDIEPFFLSEENIEHNVKDLKEHRAHNSFQGDAEKQLLQIASRKWQTSYPPVMKFIQDEILPTRRQKKLSDAAKALLLDEEIDIIDASRENDNYDSDQSDSESEEEIEVSDYDLSELEAGDSSDEDD